MKAGRVVCLVGVGITFGVVALVSVWVIPRVATDTSPIASPESAVNSFRVLVIANVIFGIVMLGATFIARHTMSTVLLGLAGVGVLVFGLWLLDGAFSFTEHGPSLQGVVVVLFVCVDGEFLAGILAFVGAVLVARFEEYTFLSTAPMHRLYARQTVLHVYSASSVYSPPCKLNYAVISTFCMTTPAIAPSASL